jgi:hypothetical protein
MNVQAGEGREHVAASFGENFGKNNTGTFSAEEYLLVFQMLRRDGLHLAAKRLLPRLSALYGLLLFEMLRRRWEDSKKSQTNLRV